MKIRWNKRDGKCVLAEWTWQYAWRYNAIAPVKWERATIFSKRYVTQKRRPLQNNILEKIRHEEKNKWENETQKGKGFFFPLSEWSSRGEIQVAYYFHIRIRIFNSKTEALLLYYRIQCFCSYLVCYRIACWKTASLRTVNIEQFSNYSQIEKWKYSLIHILFFVFESEAIKFSISMDLTATELKHTAFEMLAHNRANTIKLIISGTSLVVNQ